MAAVVHSTGAELPQQTAANPSRKAPSQHAPGQTSCPTLTHPKTHKKQKEPSQRLLGCFALLLFIYSHCCDCHYYRTQHTGHDRSLFCSTLHHRPLCSSTQICRIFLIWSVTKIWPNYLSVFVVVCCTQHRSLPHLSLNQCLSYTWIPMSNSISYKCKDIAGTWWVLMNTSCLICQTLNTANDVQTVANGQDLRLYTNPLWRCYEFCSFSPHLLIAAFFETSWIASVSVVLTLTKFLRQYNSKSTVRSSLNWMGFGQNAVIEWNTDCRTKWHQIISSGSFTSRGILPTNSVPEICFSSNMLWI